jgi:hypothetical protein
VDWPWLHLRYSLGLGLLDAWRKTSEHVVIGVIVVLTGAGLAWLATRQFGDALLLLLAWPAAFAVVYAYFLTRRLAGRDPQWEHWYNTPAVEDGRQLNVRIMWGNPPLPPGREFSVWLRDSAGKETELTTGGAIAGRGWIHATVQGTPGTYVAIFRERKPPTSGRWHLTAYFRVVVPDLPPEFKAAASRQLAIERIATELARQLGAGQEDKYQAWLNYLSGSDKNAQRPADPPQG